MDYSQPPTILQFIQCNERGDDDGSFLVLSSVLIDWVSVLSCPVLSHITSFGSIRTYIINMDLFITVEDGLTLIRGTRKYVPEQ